MRDETSGRSSRSNWKALAQNRPSSGQGNCSER